MNANLVPNILIKPRYPAAVNCKESDFEFLVDLLTPEPIKADGVRPSLNLALVLDVSPSMRERSQKPKSVHVPGSWQQRRRHAPNHFPTWPIGTPHPIFGPTDILCGAKSTFESAHPQPETPPKSGFEWYWLPPSVTYEHVPSRMDRVKDASIAAVQALGPQDRVAIVKFSTSAEVVFESSLATPDNRAKCIEAIKGLTPNGNGTSVHDGWKLGARVVCDNLAPSIVSRVLLLTDGEINAGLRDPAAICEHVKGLTGHGVTTSTFGVGDSFNEDLLLSMAETGDGRFHFIDPETIEKQFAAEFRGLSHLFGRNVSLEISTSEGYSVMECLNGISLKNGILTLPNLIRGSGQSFAIRGKTTSSRKKHLQFKVRLQWIGINGVASEATASIDVPLVTEKKFSFLKENPEVGQRIGELEIAQAQRNIIKALDLGDYERSKSLLRGAMACASASSYSGVNDQYAGLASLSVMADSGDVKMLRKTALFSSYETANNRKS